MTELEFGARLKRLRQNKHLTQQELADQLGVSNKSVSRWESGGYPDVTLLPPLARALDVTTDELLGCQPPLRSFGRSDWQNLMSYAFALGGGVVFYLLDLFMPSLICYMIYLAMMAYGIYLQRHYTYHSYWFYSANALMNLFINFQLTSTLFSIQLLSYASFLVSAFQRHPNWTTRVDYLFGIIVDLIPWLLLGLILTAAAQWLILRTGNTRTRFRIVRSTFSPDKAVPGLIPLVLCAFFALYLVEDIQYAWAYGKQIMLYLLVWLTATVLACLWLVLRRHKWMLLPAGLMQLLCLTIPTLAARRVYSSISNRFMPYSTSLAEDMYTIFGQFSPQLLLIAILLAALYLLCCMIKIESPPE